MSFLNKVKLVFKMSSFQGFLLVGLGYGVIFGGVFSGFGDGYSIEGIIDATIISTCMFSCMFMIIMPFIFPLITSKALLTMSVSRKDVQKMFLMNAFISSVVMSSFALVIVIYWNIKQLFVPEAGIRVLNMSLSHMSPVNWIVLIGMLILTALTIMSLISFICVAGINFGKFGALAASVAVVGLGAYFLYDIFDLVELGAHMTEAVLIMAVLSLLGYAVSYKGIYYVEVTK